MSVCVKIVQNMILQILHYGLCQFWKVQNSALFTIGLKMYNIRIFNSQAEWNYCFILTDQTCMKKDLNWKFNQTLQISILILNYNELQWFAITISLIFLITCMTALNTCAWGLRIVQSHLFLLIGYFAYPLNLIKKKNSSY